MVGASTTAASAFQASRALRALSRHASGAFQPLSASPSSPSAALGVRHQRQRVMLGGVERLDVEADDPALQGSRTIVRDAGGEILQARADGKHEIGFRAPSALAAEVPVTPIAPIAIG